MSVTLFFIYAACDLYYPPQTLDPCDHPRAVKTQLFPNTRHRAYSLQARTRAPVHRSYPRALSSRARTSPMSSAFSSPFASPREAAQPAAISACVGSVACWWSRIALARMVQKTMMALVPLLLVAAAVTVAVAIPVPVPLWMASLCQSHFRVGLLLRSGPLVASKEAISWYLPSPQGHLLSHCRHAHRDQTEMKKGETGTDSHNILPRKSVSFHNSDHPLLGLPLGERRQRRINRLLELCP